jgi:hypothetical protein
MAKIGDLTVNLVARTGKFTKGMKSARRSVRSFMGRLGRLHLALSGLRQVMGPLVRNFADLDKLGKTASKLGMTTEALGALRFAGERTGVAMNTMDMALQRMVRRISEAARGSGEARGAIAELGLDARKLADLSPDKQFKEIARAMGLVINQGDRVRLAMRLFDSEGVALVTTLALGADGLDEVTKKFYGLGGAISSEGVAKFEAVKDTLGDATAGFMNAAKVLLIELAPALKTILEILTDISRVTILAVRGLTKLGSTLVSPFTKAFEFFGGKPDIGPVSQSIGGAPNVASNEERKQTELLAEIVFDNKRRTNVVLSPVRL